VIAVARPIPREVGTTTAKLESSSVWMMPVFTTRKVQTSAASKLAMR